MSDIFAAANAARSALSRIPGDLCGDEFYRAKHDARASVRTLLGPGVPFMLRFEGPGEMWLHIGGEMVNIEI